MLTPLQPQRVRVGPVLVDRVTFAEALDAVRDLVERRRGGTVFTPNVDHVVMASEDDRFRGAYADVDLSLADGMPVVWASRALGAPLPERVAGSDLCAPLMQRAAEKGWRVYLLGGGRGSVRRAASRLRAAYPDLRIVGTASPRIDMTEPELERRAIVDAIRAVAPDLVLVGLGAPKQELWIHESAAALAPAVLLGVGASIDFLAGNAHRAPGWMSAAGLEWLYRLAREPGRLWRRYLLRDPRFLGILLSQIARARGWKSERPS
jgi:N-acetylglucosaminyldiphosphoundecaprenol N-acetyl-beta-D-mannosaminyltransferase